MGEHERWIDLRQYMNDNYTNDLDIKGFAHYTGRSLPAFKKEFETSPTTTEAEQT